MLIPCMTHSLHPRASNRSHASRVARDIADRERQSREERSVELTGAPLQTVPSIHDSQLKRLLAFTCYIAFSSKERDGRDSKEALAGD